MSFRDWIEMVGVIVDIGGVVVIVLGILVSLGAFAIALSRSTLFPDAYRTLRHSLGLELLVAADIVRTVAVEPTLTSVAVLALIVLVRTFLSFSLEVELEGRWPWQRSSAPDRS